MKYGFFRFFHSASAAAPFGSVFATDRGKSTEIKFPPTCSLSRFHAAIEGHAASEGRRRLKVVLATRGRGNTGRSAADPIAFRNSLLFIRPDFLEPLVTRCRGARIGCYVADLVGHSPQLL